MSNLRTRIVRLAAASALTLGLGALGAGPAAASYNSWAGSAPVEETVDGIGRGSGANADAKPDACCSRAG